MSGEFGGHVSGAMKSGVVRRQCLPFENER